MTSRADRDNLEIVSNATAQVIYDGPALHDGSMDVRDLAPALLKLGQLCEAANGVLNGPDTDIRVQVLTDFKGGSFDIVFRVLQTLRSRAKGLFGRDNVIPAAAILEYLGIRPSDAPTFLSIMRARAGKPIGASEPRTILSDGRISVGDLPAMSPHVLKLYDTPGVHEKALGVMQPVATREGITVVQFRADGKVAQEIFKDEVVEIEENADESEEEDAEPLTDNIGIIALEIVTVPLGHPERPWSFGAGSQTYRAKIMDKEFLSRHHQKIERYAIGDVLRVKMRTVTWRTARGGVAARYEIVEVIGRVGGGIDPQASLPT